MTERKRKVKFADTELHVLTREVQRHQSQIQSRTLSPSERLHIWQTIARHVSAVGICRRLAEDCKRRWTDHKRRPREKISFNIRQAAATAGEAGEARLTGVKEEEVQDILKIEQIDDLEGVDTAEPDDFEDCSSRRPISHQDDSPSHLTASTLEPRETGAIPPSSSVPNAINYAEIDQILYLEQQKQSGAQMQYASVLGGVEEEMKGLRHEVAQSASSSQQVVSALEGLNANISSWRSQMQANHLGLLAALGRIADALEANC